MFTTSALFANQSLLVYVKLNNEIHKLCWCYSVLYWAVLCSKSNTIDYCVKYNIDCTEEISECNTQRDVASTLYCNKQCNAQSNVQCQHAL